MSISVGALFEIGEPLTARAVNKDKAGANAIVNFIVV
jgi:hypothetical protein